MAKFFDEAEIFVKGGKGGDGLTSFLHEKFRAKGGPSGGDGGYGGSVFLVANENINTLVDIVRLRKFFAEDGQKGKKKKMHGRNGEDIYVELPIGTQIIDSETNELIYDLKDHGEKFCVAKGGRGGFGNAHFTSSKRQLPAFSELGEPGEKKSLKLQLKLIADVGIIGLPNAGKSTLISKISSAKPKVADYPFTTLIPNLGVVKFHNTSLTFADVPGLIPGAHTGKGLGVKFLKHVERCSVLVHLIDGISEDPYRDYETIESELKLFSEEVYSKPRIIALNKVDALDFDIPPEFEKLEAKIFKISAVNGNGTENLLGEIFKVVSEHKQKIAEEEEGKEQEIKVELKQIRTVAEKLKDGKYKLTGSKIESLAIRTDWKNHQAIRRFFDVVKKIGVEKRLLNLGIKQGDKLYVGERKLIWGEENIEN